MANTTGQGETTAAFRWTHVGWVVLCGTSTLACAEIREPVRRQQCFDYQSDVQPVLTGACAACHGGDAPAGDFRVGSYRDLVSPAADGSLRVEAG
ncbi:MAG: hypothetical protein HYZ27_06900, partial [Deltaproteobacteria bacterium]|nr:hypothetical protein [Deltaproteobacteria bacterium]